MIQKITGIRINPAQKECVVEADFFGFSSEHFAKKVYQSGEWEKEFVIDAIPFSHEVASFEELFTLCEVVPHDVSFSEEQIVATVRQQKEELLVKKADAVFFVLDEGQGIYSMACVFFSVHQGTSTTGIVKLDLTKGPHFKGYFPHMFVVPSRN